MSTSPPVQGVTAAFASQSGGGRLPCRWVFWQDAFETGDGGAVTHSLEDLGETDSPKSFWGLFEANSVARSLPAHSSLFVFRSTVKPVWSDRGVAQGGHYRITAAAATAASAAAQLWTDLVGAVVRERLIANADVVGCGFTNHGADGGAIVSLWLRVRPDAGLAAQASTDIARLVPRGAFDVRFVPHEATAHCEGARFAARGAAAPPRPSAASPFLSLDLDGDSSGPTTPSAGLSNGSLAERRKGAALALDAGVVRRSPPPQTLAAGSAGPSAAAGGSGADAPVAPVAVPATGRGDSPQPRSVRRADGRVDRIISPPASTTKLASGSVSTSFLAESSHQGSGVYLPSVEPSPMKCWAAGWSPSLLEQPIRGNNLFGQFSEERAKDAEAAGERAKGVSGSDTGSERGETAVPSVSPGSAHLPSPKLEERRTHPPVQPPPANNGGNQPRPQQQPPEQPQPQQQQHKPKSSVSSTRNDPYGPSVFPPAAAVNTPAPGLAQNAHGAQPWHAPQQQHQRNQLQHQNHQQQQQHQNQQHHQNQQGASAVGGGGAQVFDPHSRSFVQVSVGAAAAAVAQATQQAFFTSAFQQQQQHLQQQHQLQQLLLLQLQQRYGGMPGQPAVGVPNALGGVSFAVSGSGDTLHAPQGAGGPVGAVFLPFNPATQGANRNQYGGFAGRPGHPQMFGTAAAALRGGHGSSGSVSGGSVSSGGGGRPPSSHPMGTGSFGARRNDGGFDHQNNNGHAAAAAAANAASAAKAADETKSEAAAFILKGWLYPAGLNRKERRRICFQGIVDPRTVAGAVYVGTGVPDGALEDGAPLPPAVPLPEGWTPPNAENAGGRGSPAPSVSVASSAAASNAPSPSVPTAAASPCTAHAEEDGPPVVDEQKRSTWRGLVGPNQRCKDAAGGHAM